MPTEYRRKMLYSLWLVLFFDTVVIVTKEDLFNYNTYTATISVYIMDVLCFGLFNLFLARSVIKPIVSVNAGLNQAAVINRVMALPLLSATATMLTGLVPSLTWGTATLLTKTVSATGIISLFTGLFFGYMLFPGFIMYLVIDNYTKELKKQLYDRYKFEFPHGRTKLFTKLMYMFFVLAIMPMIIIFLDVASSGYLGKIIFSQDSYIIAVIITAFFAVLLGAWLLTDNLTGSIKFIAGAFTRVKNGDYSFSLPVIEDDEKGILLESFNVMTKGLREREFIKDTFGKYISPEVAEELLKNEVTLTGTEKEVTVLFTDIESYTTLSEKLSPAEVVSLLNEYFSGLVGIITAHKGVVNKFIGDAIMAVFNDPVEDPFHTDNALRAAREINARFNIQASRLKTRIGINTGKVIVGNIGTENRMEYTVIGDTVNTAQRLEAANKEFGTRILIGPRTYELLQDTNGLRKMGTAKLKGKAEELEVYSVEGDTKEEAN